MGSHLSYPKLKSLTSPSGKFSDEATEEGELISTEPGDNISLRSGSPKTETPKPNKMIKGFLK